MIRTFVPVFARAIGPSYEVDRALVTFCTTFTMLARNIMREMSSGTISDLTTSAQL